MSQQHTYSWHVSGDTITVITQDGSIRHLSRANKYGDTVLRMLVNEASEADVLTMFNRAEALRKTVGEISAKLGENVLKVSNANGTTVVTYNGEQLGGVVVNKIIEFMDLGLPVAHLAKFLARLMANPSFNSRQQLYSFLQVLQAPITCEGTFLAYKGVKADYKDCHTGTIDNSPGAEPPRMNRASVDDNPNNHCSHGYHVGAWQYASTFGARTVLVEVDPADVVSVPSDHGAMKCRVCAYKVLADVTQPLEGPLKDVHPGRDDGADDDDDDDDDDDEIVCQECGEEAKLSEDGSVIACNGDPDECDILYTCTECGIVLKRTDDPADYKPNFCPTCGAQLGYDFE